MEEGIVGVAEREVSEPSTKMSGIAAPSPIITLPWRIKVCGVSSDAGSSVEFS